MKATLARPPFIQKHIRYHCLLCSGTIGCAPTENKNSLPCYIKSCTQTLNSLLFPHCLHLQPNFKKIGIFLHMNNSSMRQSDIR